MFLAITAIIGSLFLLLHNHLPHTFNVYGYSVIVGVSCFVFLGVYGISLKLMSNYHLVLILIAVTLFLSIGTLLSRIVLDGDKAVTVQIEAKIPLNDELQLFYIPVGDKMEKESNSVNHKVLGSDYEQTISISLSDTIPINKMRLDLSKDSIQKQIEIERIFITYNDNHVVLFNVSNDYSYFSPNEYVKRDKSQFTLFAIDGKYDPFIYSSDFYSEYSNLLAQKKHLPFPFVIAFILVFSILVYVIFFIPHTNFKTAFYTFSSCLFIVVLFLPFLNQTLHFYKDTEANQEKRELAAKPSLALSTILDYPKQYEAYYNDNFGFRNWLVKMGGYIKYQLFNVSSVPLKASIGKDGWLFLNGTFYEITQDLTKSSLYSRHELERSIKEWEDRKIDLRKDSVVYYKAFWPDKHYIYKEFLPFNMQVLNKDTVAKCDQAIDYLNKKKSSLHIIDVRGLLLEEKKRNTVYSKHDSHWNSYGAFVAYTELMKQMSVKFPVLKPHTLADYKVTWQEEVGGDLSSMLGLELKELKPSFVLSNDSSCIAELPVNDYPVKTLIYENQSASSNLTLLIFRDSFTTAMIPFLQPHFKRIVLIWDTPYSKELVKKVDPEIVLECYATRYFR